MRQVAQIASTGRYIPDKALTNADLDRMLGEPVDEWLVENVGIRERHVIGQKDLHAVCRRGWCRHRQRRGRAGFPGRVVDRSGEYHDALGICTGGTFRPATLENVQRYGVCPPIP